MIPYKAIGFQAENVDHQGETYDCSFVITFPMMMNIPPEQVASIEAQAIEQAKYYHRGCTIKARLEKVIMMNGHPGGFEG